MEVQLEEEYDEKQKVLKEKRELESKLLLAQDKVTALTKCDASQCCWNWNNILTKCVSCVTTPQVYLFPR